MRDLDQNTNPVAMWDVDGGCPVSPGLVGRCRGCVRASGDAALTSELNALEADEKRRGRTHLRFSSLIPYTCDNHATAAGARALKGAAARKAKATARAGIAARASKAAAAAARRRAAAAAAAAASSSKSNTAAVAAIDEGEEEEGEDEVFDKDAEDEEADNEDDEDADEDADDEDADDEDGDHEDDDEEEDDDEDDNDSMPRAWHQMQLDGNRMYDGDSRYADAHGFR
jgi:hypothetical protein